MKLRSYLTMRLVNTLMKSNKYHLLIFSVLGGAHAGEEEKPALFRGWATSVSSSSNILSFVFSLELDGHVNHVGRAVCKHGKRSMGQTCIAKTCAGSCHLQKW